ncbi:hypothetical protein A1F94_013037 [Pyrenophora tritici-repentis]|nr:hypothetical protein A1F94_013037 [Pyrenophora tritici-repentis]
MHESGEGMSRVGTAMVRLARLTLQGQHDPYDDLVAADEMTTQEIVDALYPTDARLTAIRDALNNGHRRILTTLLLKVCGWNWAILKPTLRKLLCAITAFLSHSARN